MDIERKITAIKKWANKYNKSPYRQKKFDTSFIESIEDWIVNNEPSYAQEIAIDNIIKNFRIRV